MNITAIQSDARCTVLVDALHIGEQTLSQEHTRVLRLVC